MKEEIQRGIKEEIQCRLDEQNVKDFKFLMLTKEGRRFFSWLVEKCGQNQTSFTGNSDTFRREGQRNIALILEALCKFIGLDGVDLMHKAEKEYIILQMDLLNEINAEVINMQNGNKPTSYRK